MFWILCTVNKQTKTQQFSDWHASPSSGRQKNSLLLGVLRWYRGHELRVYEQTTGYFSNNWQKECLHSNTFKSKKLFGKKFQKFILYSRTPFGKLNTDRGVQFILKFSMEIPLSTNRCPVGSLFKFLYGYVSMAKLAFQGFRDKIILIMINLRILGA